MFDPFFFDIFPVCGLVVGNTEEASSSPCLLKYKSSGVWNKMRLGATKTAKSYQL